MIPFQPYCFPVAHCPIGWLWSCAIDIHVCDLSFCLIWGSHLACTGITLLCAKKLFLAVLGGTYGMRGNKTGLDTCKTHCVIASVPVCNVFTVHSAPQSLEYPMGIHGPGWETHSRRRDMQKKIDKPSDASYEGNTFGWCHLTLRIWGWQWQESNFRLDNHNESC